MNTTAYTHTLSTTGTIDIGITQQPVYAPAASASAVNSAAATRTHTIRTAAPTYGCAQVDTSAKPSQSDMWHSTVVLKTPQGMEEAFSIGPDGYVWHYLVGRYQATGGRLFSTGLKASVFNVTHLADGRRMVIAADLLSLHFCVEEAPGTGRWSAAQDVPFNTLRGTMSIEKIMLQTKGQQLLIGVVTQRASEMGYRLLELWDGVWSNDRPVFCKAPTRARTTPENVWRAQFAQEMPNVERYGPVYRQREADPVAAAAQSMRHAG